MSPTKLGLFAALLVVNVAFVMAWVRDARRRTVRPAPRTADIAIGFVTDFLDALGIGSFAPTTALFKLRGIPPDELIPGTLNVGHNAAAILETVVFVTVVAVEPALLAAMVASATIGAWLGAGVVSRLPRRAIQLFMGLALLTAAIFFLMANFGAFPAGGTAMGLAGWRFGLAVSVNFVLGALMSVGIGAYAPCMVLLALLGLHPLGASHHDGHLRARAADGQPALLQDRPLRVRARARTHDRRRLWCARRDFYRAAVAFAGLALAHHRRRRLCGRVDVAVGVSRTRGRPGYSGDMTFSSAFSSWT